MTARVPARTQASYVTRLFGNSRSSLPGAPAFGLASALILGLVLLPVAAVLYLALGTAPQGTSATAILPEALANTALLAAGTGLVTLAVGTGAAWLVTMYRFPGRSYVDRALVLPLAMPTYIVAYCYADLLDFAGPVQSWLRHAMGYQNVHDYWFPQVRSLPGAVFVMSAVLYPYVYLTARASFEQQSVCVLEVARTLGRTPWGVCREVALPMARPALVAGVLLVVMEALNDLGAVQHLGVQSLSAGIYATWLQKSDLPGAARLSAVMLCLVVAAVLIERWARDGRAWHHTTGRYRAIPFEELGGARGYAVLALCAVPVLIGFAVPVLLLLPAAIKHWHEASEAGLWAAALNSMTLAAIASCLAVAAALIAAYACRVSGTRLARHTTAIASLGYAMPGTVLAIGLMIPLAALDNRVDALFREQFGTSTGLVISGSIAAIVIAYLIRFLAAALGSIEAGFERISPNLDAAARTLGETAATTLKRVHLPLLLPALGAGALLVFVDVMKELPATLLMRPFDFETLATSVYALAALEKFEHAAAAALMIVAAGMLPVLLLHKALADGRSGGD